jgi:hypothetical protein
MTRSYRSGPGGPWTLAVLALALVACAGAASGQDLRFPPLPLQDRPGYEVNSWLKLKPYLRQGVFYTDNVFQETNSERNGDTYWSTTPGLDVHAKADDDTWLEAGYAPTFLVYHHLGGLDTVEHRLRYIGRHRAGGLEVNSGGTATWASYNSDPQFAGRIRNFQGAVNLDVAYDFDEVWGAKVTSFASESRNFPSALEPTNTQEWGAGLLGSAAPKLGPELRLLAGGTFREVHYFDHAARQPDLSLAGAVAGGKLELKDVVRVDALGGVEFPWVKKRNAASGDVNPDPTPILNLTSLWFITSGTELLVAVRHRLEGSSTAAYQRSSTLSCALSQELPADLNLRVVATWTEQKPRHASDIRLQSYQAILVWSPWEHLELGVQGGYQRQGIKGGGYESLVAGGAITFKL